MKFCARCRQPAPTSPCPSCQRQRDRDRGAPRDRGYDDAWTALSREARRLQPWCTRCGATDDLTTDHIIPLAVTGYAVRPTLADVTVLCRPCNSSKGGRTPEAPGEGTSAPGVGPPGRRTASYSLGDAMRFLGLSDEPEAPGGGISW